MKRLRFAFDAAIRCDAATFNAPKSQEVLGVRAQHSDNSHVQEVTMLVWEEDVRPSTVQGASTALPLSTAAHEAPRDFWRFTRWGLERMVSEAGLVDGELLLDLEYDPEAHADTAKFEAATVPEGAAPRNALTLLQMLR